MEKHQQIAALQVARMVRSGELTRAEGARHLSKVAGIPATSAGILNAVYVNMSKGQVFKRTLNASDMNFFIAAIANEEGNARLRNALAALKLHIKYRESEGVNPLKSKAILEKYESRLEAPITDISTVPVYLHDLESSFNDKVQSATKSSHEERQKRLSNAPKLPKRVAKLVYVFERNPDVVIEVLLRAQGICEGCKTEAPFLRRSDGTPYLEVHHRRPLSENGEDTVQNAIALCPNCHRHSHFGLS